MVPPRNNGEAPEPHRRGNGRLEDLHDNNERGARPFGPDSGNVRPAATILVMPSRALVDLSEAELEDALRAQAEHVIYSYTDLLHELDRRATLRLARVAILLSAIGMVVAVIALVLVALDLGRG